MTWTIAPISEFNRHRAAWDRLNETGPNSPVLHSDFYSALLDNFPRSGDVLAIHGNSTDPDAIAIFGKAKFGVWDTYQPSQAPLGAWLSSATAAPEPLLKELAKALPGIVLKIGITQQDPDILSRSPDSRTLQTLDYIQTARITLNGSFEEYWSSRGKNLRNNMKKQRNALRKSGTSLRLNIVSSPDDVDAAVAAYGALESAGWKSEGGTAVSVDNSQGRFYCGMLRAFCQRNAGRIYQYYFDDNLVATDLCVLQGGTIVILKTTYDETQKTTSPALLMRQEALPLLYNDNAVQRIEFYGRVMDWHTKWSDELRTLYHVNITRLLFP